MAEANAAAQAAARAIVGQLAASGAQVAASLPDSWLTAILCELDRVPALRHVRVTREDDAVGVCAGAALGGRRGVVVCQNAGLLVSVNALAGFAHHHQLPLLVLAAHRGDRDDRYFYQAYKARVTVPVLQEIGVPHHVMPEVLDLRLIADAMEQAWVHRRPVVVLFQRQALLGKDTEAADAAR